MYELETFDDNFHPGQNLPDVVLHQRSVDNSVPDQNDSRSMPMMEHGRNERRDREFDRDNGPRSGPENGREAIGRRTSMGPSRHGTNRRSGIPEPSIPPRTARLNQQNTNF